MKKILLFLALALSWGACAVTVELSSNLTMYPVDENHSVVRLRPDESIQFRVSALDIGSSSGSFMISKDAGNGSFVLVGRPHFVCVSCGASLGRDAVGGDYNFVASEEGVYRAEASYGGVSKTIDLLVYEPTTTSTTTTTTTTSTTTSTTSSTTSSTTTSSSSSTSSTVYVSRVRNNLMTLYFLGVCIVVLVFFFLGARRR